MRTLARWAVVLGVLVGGCASVGSGEILGARVTPELRRACPFMTDAEIKESLDGAVHDLTVGWTRQEELSSLYSVCSEYPGAVFSSCYTCGAALVDHVYP